jgi:pimeloyl-ACP methyl ester carboxylesterase
MEFDLPSSEIEIEGATLRISRFPEAAGPALICVPGYGATGESFARLRPLAASFDIHLPTPPEEARRADDPVARFGAIVAAYARRFDHPILLGTSFGGPIAISAASQLGDAIAGLVLISTFASLPRSPLRPLIRILPLLEWFAEHTRRFGVHLLAGRNLDRAAAHPRHARPHRPHPRRAAAGRAHPARGVSPAARRGTRAVRDARRRGAGQAEACPHMVWGQALACPVRRLPHLP